MSLNKSQKYPSSFLTEPSSPSAELKKRHGQILVQFNEAIFKRNVLTDVECVVQGKVFKAHRALLVCFSPYLKKKLLNADGKPTLKRVQIPKIGANEFEMLLEYMYTGNVTVDCNTFFDVYKAASLLEIKEAKQEFLKLINPQLTNGKDEIRTYFYTYVLSKKLGVQNNWQHAFKLITHRFEETVFSRVFMQLNLNYVVEILSAQTIGARSETIVFLAALNWLNYDIGSRGVYAVAVMECVRFSCMSLEEIVACYHPPFLTHIVQIPDVMLMLYRATCYIAAKCEGQENLFKQYANPKRNFTFEHLPMELWHKRFPPSVSTAENQRVKDLNTSYDYSNRAEASDGRRFEPPVQIATDPVGDKNLVKPSHQDSGCDPVFEAESNDAISLRAERNMLSLDQLFKETDTESRESSLNNADFEDEYSAKDEMLRDVLQNKQFETEKVPFRMSEKGPEIVDRQYDKPEQTKIVHFSGGPKRYFKAKSASERENNFTPPFKKASPVAEFVSEGFDKVEELSSEMELHKNCKDLQRITVSVTKCSHEKRKNLTKIASSESVDIPPMEVNTTPEHKLKGDDDSNSEQSLLRKEETSFKEVGDNQDMKSDSCILIIGGMNLKNVKKDDGAFVSRFDSKTNEIKHYTFIPEPRHNHCSLCLDNCLYVIGGCKPQDTIEKNRYIAKQSCFKLDLKTMKWSILPELKCARYDHSVVVHDSHLFAIGGQDETGRLLKSIEVYDLKRSRWRLLNSSMCCGRKAMGAALYNDRIWIVGGLIESEKQGHLQAVSIVDFYDPKENRWYFNIYSLPSARCFCSLVIWDRKLFLIGGMIRTDKDRICSTDEVWFVDNENELWKKGPPLLDPRMGGAAFTHDKNLYYLGGFDPESSVSDQYVLILSPGAITWHVGPQLTHLFGLSAVSSQ